MHNHNPNLIITLGYIKGAHVGDFLSLGFHDFYTVKAFWVRDFGAKI